MEDLWSHGCHHSYSDNHLESYKSHTSIESELYLGWALVCFQNSATYWDVNLA